MSVPMLHFLHAHFIPDDPRKPDSTTLRNELITREKFIALWLKDAKDDYERETRLAHELKGGDIFDLSETPSHWNPSPRQNLLLVVDID